MDRGSRFVVRGAVLSGTVLSSPFLCCAVLLCCLVRSCAVLSSCAVQSVPVVRSCLLGFGRGGTLRGCSCRAALLGGASKEVVLFSFVDLVCWLSGGAGASTQHLG